MIVFSSATVMASDRVFMCREDVAVYHPNDCKYTGGDAASAVIVHAELVKEHCPRPPACPDCKMHCECDSGASASTSTSWLADLIRVIDMVARMLQHDWSTIARNCAVLAIAWKARFLLASVFVHAVRYLEMFGCAVMPSAVMPIRHRHSPLVTLSTAPDKHVDTHVLSKRCNHFIKKHGVQCSKVGIPIGCDGLAYCTSCIKWHR